METIENILVNYFKKNPLMHELSALSDSDQLFALGLLDSLNLMLLIAFLEHTFKISIKMSEITIDNFATIAKIASLVRNNSSN